MSDARNGHERGHRSRTLVPPPSHTTTTTSAGGVCAPEASSKPLRESSSAPPRKPPAPPSRWLRRKPPTMSAPIAATTKGRVQIALTPQALHGGSTARETRFPLLEERRHGLACVL